MFQTINQNKFIPDSSPQFATPCGAPCGEWPLVPLGAPPEAPLHGADDGVAGGFMDVYSIYNYMFSLLYNIYKLI